MCQGRPRKQREMMGKAETYTMLVLSIDFSSSYPSEFYIFASRLLASYLLGSLKVSTTVTSRLSVGLPIGSRPMRVV